MKLILVCLVALFIAAACSPIRDQRTDAKRQSDQATREARPYSAMEGVLHVRVVRPDVVIEPHVVPDWTYVVTPDASKVVK